MRYPVTAFALTAALLSGSADAQQPTTRWIPLPYPTDTGKPVIYDPQYVAKAESDRLSGCAPLLQCRLQLLGVIQNNGSVELRTTAFKW